MNGPIDEVTVEYLRDLNPGAWKNIPKCLVEVLNSVVALLLSHEVKILSLREFEAEQRSTNKGTITRFMMLEESMNKLVVDTSSKFSSTLKDNMAAVTELHKQAEDQTGALSQQVYGQAEAMRKAAEAAEAQRLAVMARIEELERRMVKQGEELVGNAVQLVEEGKREFRNSPGLYGDKEECKSLSEYLLKMKNDYENKISTYKQAAESQSQGLKASVQLEYRELEAKINQVQKLAEDAKEQLKDESKIDLKLAQAIEASKKEMFDKMAVLTSENLESRCGVLETALKRLEAERREAEEAEKREMAGIGESVAKMEEVQAALLSSFEAQQKELQKCKAVISSLNATFKETADATEMLRTRLPDKVLVKENNYRANAEDSVGKVMKEPEAVKHSEDAKARSSRNEAYQKESSDNQPSRHEEIVKTKSETNNEYNEKQRADQNEIKASPLLPVGNSAASSVQHKTTVEPTERVAQRIEEVKGATDFKGPTAIASKTGVVKSEPKRASVYERLGKNVSLGQQEAEKKSIPENELEELAEISNRNIASIDNLQDSSMYSKELPQESPSNLDEVVQEAEIDQAIEDEGNKTPERRKDSERKGEFVEEVKAKQGEDAQIVPEQKTNIKPERKPEEKKKLVVDKRFKETRNF